MEDSSITVFMMSVHINILLNLATSRTKLEGSP